MGSEMCIRDRLHGDKENCFDSAIDALEGAIEISDTTPDDSPLILDKISL